MNIPLTTFIIVLLALLAINAALTGMVAWYAAIPSVLVLAAYLGHAIYEELSARIKQFKALGIITD